CGKARVGSSRRGLYPEFLKRVYRDETVCPARQTGGAGLPSKSRARITDISSYSEICAHSVYRPIIRALTLPIHDEGIRVSLPASGQHTRRQLDQTLKTPAIQRKVIREFAVHDGAYRCVCGVDVESFCRDGNVLAGRAHRQYDVAGQAVLGIQRKLRNGYRLETGFP